MKKKTVMAVIIIAALTVNVCAQQGGRQINSADELKKYLDSQPANGPNNPIKVTMSVNDLMIKNVASVINNADKYVSLTLSGNVLTTIPDKAFSGCDSLTGITIPNSVTSIGYNAFDECTSLASITIPNSVTSIESGAFSGCDSLTSITIPDSVTEIGSGIFYKCTGLVSVILGKNVTGIDDRAFSDCESLTSITIPDSVTSIGYRAFSSCTSLTSITIPSSVTEIKNAVFSRCNNLTAINIDAVNTSYSSDNGVVYNKNKTTLVAYPSGKKGAFTIPDSVITVGESAFSGCIGLTDIIIPDSVTTIESSAFSQCENLVSATIGNSVTRIGDAAFEQCDNLTKVIFQGTVSSRNFGGWGSFPGNFRETYLSRSGGIGTYTRPNSESNRWNKQ